MRETHGGIDYQTILEMPWLDLVEEWGTARQLAGRR
jgi:hypothetical protein